MIDQTKRLTARRVNGIKTGFWSAAKKDELVNRLADYEETGCTPEDIDELVNRLADYEETGCTPEDIYAILASKGGTWIDTETALPNYGETVLVARVKHPNLPPIVEQATRGLNGWWKVYGTNVKKIIAWRPMPAAPEGIEIR